MQKLNRITRQGFIIACFIIFYGTTELSLKAQTIVAGSGDHLKNTENQISFTLGEVATETLQTTNIKLTQGFHQTKLKITAIKDIEETNYELLAYPNPTSDFVKLTVVGESWKNLSYFLYDINGVLIQKKIITANETIISFENYQPAIYLIKITKNKKEVKTYRIVKQ